MAKQKINESIQVSTSFSLQTNTNKKSINNNTNKPKPIDSIKANPRKKKG